MDISAYDKIQKEARDIFVSRQSNYGDSTSMIDLHTIAGIVMMKLNRIYQLGKNAKVRDELLDSLNYCIFALDKYDNNHIKDGNHKSKESK